MIKRIQFIYETHDGKSQKFWQFIDFNQMITLEHVWNNLNKHLVLISNNKKYRFYYYNTKQILPSWYHIDLLKDNDQILIKEIIENIPSQSSEPIKHISKKKQLKASVTNRSFIITNKYSISEDFYQQWEEGKMHKNTNNCRMIF